MPAPSSRIRLQIERFPDVCERTGLCRSYINHLRSIGQFPDHIQLGPRVIGWDSRDIDDWIQKRIDASRASDPTQLQKYNESVKVDRTENARG